jgi:glycosyltransferase involved in cell wall biosynthesis
VKIALVCQYYPPNRTSQAVQMRDLAVGLKKLGHDIFVAVPSEHPASKSYNVDSDGISVLRIPSLKITNVNFVKRAFGELFMPFIMLRAIRGSNFPSKELDLIVWYSPSIFFGPVVYYLKKKSSCKGYLILRDMFPEWLADVGVMKKRFAYYFFKIVAMYQYGLADVIGVQSESNLSYFDGRNANQRGTVEVLENWLNSKDAQTQCPEYLTKDLLEKKIIVYTGNMGVPQGMDILIHLADFLKNRDDIHFLFVGRGTEKKRLETLVFNMNLTNVSFYDEIDSSAIQDLLKKCSLGLIALDPKHKSHNIPGKFLSYLASGLPVLARTNKGTDLEKLINFNKLGFAYTGDSVKQFAAKAIELIDDDATLGETARRGKSFFLNTYSVEKATKQITRILN